MKLIKILLLIALIFAALTFPVFLMARHHKATIVQSHDNGIRTCETKNFNCFEVTMPNQDPLYTNTYHHFAPNCIGFFASADSDYHQYCGLYAVHRVEE